MIILDYQKKYHSQLITAAVKALKLGKVVAYPTDTSYGLAADATNMAAVKKMYKIKQRGFNKPVHVVVPSISYAKKIVKWNKTATKLANKFWPGALTLVLPVGTSLGLSLRKLTAGTGFLGLRMPNNKFALDLAKSLGSPMTCPSANPPSGVGGDDSYNAQDIIRQFKLYKHKPDIIIDAGKLPKKKPSTLVKIDGEKIIVLRKGPVSERQITAAI